MGNFVITQEEKDKLVGQMVHVKYKGWNTKGRICGRLLGFPLVFIPTIGVSFEINWWLAHRAVNEGTIIQA